jgi:methylated-DNA-[protein]-cysteine S-methyltransferase
VIAAAIIRTSLGWVSAAAREGKLVAVSLPAATEAEARAVLPAGAQLAAEDEMLSRFGADLLRYCRGERADLSRYPVDLSRLPQFLRRALLAARRVPYGEVRTYQWVAARAGNARAARAAGQAMHANPLPLVIPCHRIVGSGGRLTGFGGGLAMKQALLVMEGVDCERGKVRGGRSRQAA